MSATQRPDVVVVGAGPVGLVAACELARRGIAVAVLDKLDKPTEESRAIAVHARSLDMFDRMDIIDELLATGVKSSGMNIFIKGKKLFSVPLGGVDSAFPYTLVTAQTETERVLGQRLTELGVTVQRGVEVIGLAQDDSAAHLTVRRADGTVEQLDTSWVIAADGGHSKMRHLVGTKLQGSFKGERFILGDVEAQHSLGNASMYTFFHPDGPVVTLPMRGGRVRFLAQIHDAPGAPLNTHPTQEELQQILNERIGGITITTSHWLTCFEIHHGQVPGYRHGRVFLTGDAAHIHSPAGGQGMNTGMQDAFNLAWKLAMAIRGEGGQALLDSYHAERHPIAKGVIDFTGVLTKVGTFKGAARVVRNNVVKVLAKAPPLMHRMAATVEETTVGYKSSPAVLPARRVKAKVAPGQHLPHIADTPIQKALGQAYGVDNTGHTIITVTAGKLAPAAGPGGHTQILVTTDDSPVGGYDIVIADPDGLVASRFGLAHGGRIVVRPDGYIGAITALDDPTGVADYFAKIGK
jgi:2-polyprenyl-6-methoxyphenol hydroxylase-like FAD-dependent oxidoreductase